MFNTVNQGQSVTNNYAVVQIGFYLFVNVYFNKNLRKLKLFDTLLLLVMEGGKKSWHNLDTKIDIILYASAI